MQNFLAGKKRAIVLLIIASVTLFSLPAIARANKFVISGSGDKALDNKSVKTLYDAVDMVNTSASSYALIRVTNADSVESSTLTKPVAVAAGKHIVLELSGKKLTLKGKDYHGLVVNGKGAVLEVRSEDGSGSLSVSCEKDDYCAIYVNDGGSLTVNVKLAVSANETKSRGIYAGGKSKVTLNNNLNMPNPNRIAAWVSGSSSIVINGSILPRNYARTFSFGLLNGAPVLSKAHTEVDLIPYSSYPQYTTFSNEADGVIAFDPPETTDIITKPAYAGSQFPLKGLVNGNGIELKSAASASGSKRATVNRNAELTILGFENGYFKVEWRKQFEYAYIEAVNINTAFYMPLNGVAKTTLPLYSKRNVAKEYLLGEFAEGTPVLVYTYDNKWNKVSVNEIEGYVQNSWITVNN